MRNVDNNFFFSIFQNLTISTAPVTSRFASHLIRPNILLIYFSPWNIMRPHMFIYLFVYLFVLLLWSVNLTRREKVTKPPSIFLNGGTWDSCNGKSNKINVIKITCYYLQCHWSHINISPLPLMPRRIIIFMKIY